MGIVSSIASGATEGVVASILNSNVVNRLADLIPDALARQRALQDFQVNIANIVSASDAGQSQVNAVEASRSDWFVSYWRPFIGWICGLAFAWQFLFLPICLFLESLTGKIYALPAFDSNSMIAVLMGMLGLGSMRTIEKIQAMKNS